MIAKQKLVWPLLALVAVVQSAALFDMVRARDSLLKSGREITLAVQPVDPRDLFRGDYVTLGYDISRLKAPNAQTDFAPGSLSAGSTVYVTLAGTADNSWKLTHVGSSFPSTVAPGEIVLKGRVNSTWKDEAAGETFINARYGIENYFVPEGTGRVLEDKVRSHEIKAIIAVSGDGTAALKGLIVDGERHEDPPLL